MTRTDFIDTYVATFLATYDAQHFGSYDFSIQGALQQMVERHRTMPVIALRSAEERWQVYHRAFTEDHPRVCYHCGSTATSCIGQAEKERWYCGTHYSEEMANEKTPE